MRIEEGKQYLTRSGALVGPMEPTQFGEWRGWDGGAFIYELDGRHGDETDSVYGIIPNIPENDIISLAPGSAGQNVAHTPGPWHVVVQADERPKYWIVTDPDTWVHRLAFVPDYDGLPNLANARLIAAAPQMLEALRVGLRAIRSSEGRYDVSAEFILEEAIAAATGETA